MAKGDRGKFNKRGGPGARSGFEATSAEEIELRNQRLAEFGEQRAARRGADSDDEEVIEENTGVEKAIEKVTLEEGVSEEKPLTRKQIEQADKERKAAEYRRRHELGLTEEYKRDMEKLTEVRKRREEAEQRAKAEKESQEMMEEERKKMVAAIGEDSDSEDDKNKKKKGSKKASIPKLDKISIKKMKPAQLKEALKARDLDIQGNAKELTTRLLDYEASR